MPSDIETLRAEAEQGSPVSQAILGMILLEGASIDRDPVEALRWLTLASEHKVPRAMFYLATMYEDGEVVTVDLERARRLHEAAAASGEFFACIHLARLWSRGHFVKDGPNEAARWYRHALLGCGEIVDCAELQEAKTFLASMEGPDNK